MSNTLLNLPLHPTMRHPLTGQPLRAVYIDKSGRARWPMMGGAPDDGGTGDGSGDGGKGGSGDDGADGGAGGSDKSGSGGTDSGDKGGDDKGKGGDHGFPANTPVAEMTSDQRAAYHQFHSRKHEQRASEYREAAGGLTAEQVREALAERDQLKRQSLSDHERQVEDAKKETREATVREQGLKAARAALELALGHDPEDEQNDRTDLIDPIDLSKLLTDSGDVDTVKVRKLAGQLAPADKDKGTRESHDYGGGRRGSSQGSTGTAAGAERYAQRHGKTAASSTT